MIFFFRFLSCVYRWLRSCFATDRRHILSVKLGFEAPKDTENIQVLTRRQIYIAIVILRSKKVEPSEISQSSLRPENKRVFNSGLSATLNSKARVNQCFLERLEPWLTCNASQDAAWIHVIYSERRRKNVVCNKVCSKFHVALTFR